MVLLVFVIEKFVSNILLQLINIIHFSRMSAKKYQSSQNKQQDKKQDHDSDGSDEFQQLDYQFQTNQQTVSNPKMDSRQISNDKVQSHHQCLQKHAMLLDKIQQLNSMLLSTKKNARIRQDQIIDLKKCNSSLNATIREKQNQINQFRQIFDVTLAENANLKNQIKKFEQKINLITKDNTQISIKNKSAQQRAHLQNKVNRQVHASLKKNMQKIYGTLADNRIDKILIFVQQQNQNVIQISHKINEIFGQTEQKESGSVGMKSTNRIDLVQSIYRLQKIQAAIFKVQSQITAHREYISKLQKQLQNLKKTTETGNGGFKKWFDPVMKLCKLDEPAVTRQPPNVFNANIINSNNNNKYTINTNNNHHLITQFKPTNSHIINNNHNASSGKLNLPRNQRLITGPAINTCPNMKEQAEKTAKNKQQM